MRLRSIVVLAAAVTLLVACAKESDLTVVAASVELLDRPETGATALTRSPLGARMKGKPGRKGWWKIKLPDGKEGFAPPQTLAPYPITGQARWVVAPFAGQLAEPDLASRTVTARYEIGTQLEVVGGAPWLPPEIAAVIGTGRVIGFVPVRTLGDREPRAADLLGAAREALLAGKLTEALAQGTRALRLDARHAGARALVAAIHEANGDPEAKAMRDALVAPAPTAAPASPPVTVAPGTDAYVVPAGLELRRGKSPTTEVLVKLPINTTVKVLAVDGAWAKVAWKGTRNVGANLDLDPFGEPVATPAPVAVSPPIAIAAASPVPVEVAPTPVPASTPLQEIESDDETTVGWVVAGFLGESPQDVTATAALARARASEGKLVEAVDLFERAVTLEPANLALTKELLTAAVQAERYLTAAFAALALSRGGEDLGGLEVVQMDLFYGCRGDRHQAEIDEGSYAPEADDTLPENACVRSVNLEPPCEPCDESGYDAHDEYAEYDMGADESDGETAEEEALSPEEADRRRQIAEAEEAAAAAQAAIEEAEREAERGRLAAEHQAELAEHQLYMTKIDTAYGSESWVYLELRNRQAGRMGATKVQLYRVPVANEYGSILYETGALEVREIELPPLGPQASVGLWFPAPQYVGMEYGVLRADSVEAAEKALRTAMESHGNAEWPTHHAVSIEPQDCSCGGC